MVVTCIRCDVRCVVVVVIPVMSAVVFFVLVTSITCDVRCVVVVVIPVMSAVVFFSSSRHRR